MWAQIIFQKDRVTEPTLVEKKTPVRFNFLSYSSYTVEKSMKNLKSPPGFLSSLRRTKLRVGLILCENMALLQCTVLKLYTLANRHTN